MIRIDRIDHVVLTVTDIEGTCDFYSRVLGMEVVTFDNGRRTLRFGKQKINLHRADSLIAPHAARPTAGAADLCFVTGTPIPEVAAHLTECGVAIVEGPVPRTGALGGMNSIYFRDPDSNLIEVSNYQRDAKE
jgi:catechol 2,3-dioxygenase-like lactoylglutathione lyase family enzyme